MFKLMHKSSALTTKNVFCYAFVRNVKGVKGATIVQWINSKHPLGQAGEPVFQKKRFSIRCHFGSILGLSK